MERKVITRFVSGLIVLVGFFASSVALAESVKATVNESHKSSHGYFSVPTKTTAVIKSFSSFDPLTKSTKNKLGRNILNVSSREFMVDKKGKPVMELPPGRYALVAVGGVGATATLEYDLVHIKSEVLKKNMFLTPTKWNIGDKVLFKAGAEVKYDAKGGVITGTLAKSCQLRPAGFVRGQNYPAFARDTVVVFGPKGGVVEGILAVDHMLKNKYGEDKFCRAGTLVKFSAKGTLKD